MACDAVRLLYFIACVKIACVNMSDRTGFETTSVVMLTIYVAWARKKVL
jgi:hypothetical protein